MLRKTVAAFLAASMMVGIAGCDAFGVRKEMGNVDGVIKDYGKALSNLDEDKIRLGRNRQRVRRFQGLLHLRRQC